MLKLRCNKCGAYIERLTPPSLKKRPHFKTCTCLGKNKILVIDLEETEARNDCVTNRPTKASRFESGESHESAVSSRETDPSKVIAGSEGMGGSGALTVVSRCIATPSWL
jgi:hypothetical protein